MQHTLASPVSCAGIGLHSGNLIRMTLYPAVEDSGIVFARTDVDDLTHATIPALWNHVIDTRMCTKVANEHGTYVATVEHLMAALYACEVDNVRIEISGAEIPVMDGSSEPFVTLIDSVGTKAQSAPRKVIEILKTVRYQVDDNRWVQLSPHESFVLECSFDFAERASMDKQTYLFDGTPESFKRDIMRARTFGFLQDVEKLWASGLAKGGSLDNAVVIDGIRVVNHEGFRYPDECVRHKILDAVGDLYTAGAPIHGHFTGSQPGHEMQNKLLQKLFADQSAWRLVEPARKNTTARATTTHTLATATA